VRQLFAGAVALVVLAGCPKEPRERPDVRCADACKQRVTRCTEHECERGCAFVLDRLVEHEQEPVLACIASASHCADADWADCAAHIGAHADGGPAVPPPHEIE
jgi:hypothetical protein